MKNIITYNKLIRDKIPKIIEDSGKKSQTHIADTDEYKAALLAKLIEEAKELQEEPSIEELADIIEVIESIKEVYDFKDDELEEVKYAKKENRGGFNKRIILESVYET